MPASQITGVIQHLRRSALLRDGAGMTDGQLLERFVTERDDAAFAALVRRHGATVWGVCRRVLSSHHDAEEAFQATFLVLVRRAASVVPREMVANWLHGVAHKTALKARETAARRKTRERQVAEMPEPVVNDHALWRDLQPALDQELTRLPDKYRVAIVLCDMEGKTRKEAARQLGLPEGTLSGWLTRGRTMLAKRLARQGMHLSGGALATILAQQTASATAPPALLLSTIKAAGLVSAGQAATTGVVSPAVAELMKGVLRTMLLSKTKIATTVLVGLTLVLGVAALDSLAVEQPGADKPARQPSPTAGQAGKPGTKGPGWREKYVLKHEHPVNLVSCSAKWSAAGDEGGNLFLWDTNTGKDRKLTVKGGQGQGLNTSVDRLQFTPDGTLLFAVMDGRRKLFRFSLESDKSPGLGSRNPSYLGISADGDTWLECYDGRTLTLRANVWTRGGAVNYETIEYKAQIKHALMSPDSKSLAVVTADGNLHIHESDSRRETQTITVAAKNRNVTVVQFSQDGKRIAVAGDDAVANIYDTADGKELAALKRHRGIIFAVTFSPDGKTLVSGGDDNTARIWDLTGKQLAVLEGHTDSVRSVAFDPDGTTLFTGSADKTVKAWRISRHSDHSVR
jgi:RNA polymerase sigma factor (sigma-70 family)